MCPCQSQERGKLAEMVAKLVATQREQAAEARHHWEELRDQTERHLERMANLTMLLQAWSTTLPPPPPVYPDCGEVTEEPRGATRQPEEGGQLGEVLLQSGTVEELLQPKVDEV